MKEKGWLFLTVKLQLPNVEGMKMIDDHNWANITIIILIIKNYLCIISGCFHQWTEHDEKQTICLVLKYLPMRCWLQKKIMISLQWRKLPGSTLTKWSELTLAIIRHHSHLIWCTKKNLSLLWYCCPDCLTSIWSRKNIRETTLKGCDTKFLSSILPNGQGHQRQGRTKALSETGGMPNEAWQGNAMRSPGLDAGSGKVS